MTKYRAQPTEVDGHRFASKREAARYQELRLLERAGKIVNLELQPRFECRVNGIKVCTYVADFAFVDLERAAGGGEASPRVIEDVKGVRTPVYRMKKKLVEALYPGVVIEEVR